MEKVAVLSLPITLSELASVLVFATLSVLSFFIPFTIGHPQWLVGIIVNACLFLSAIYLPKKYFIPLAILTSFGVLARGLVFGPLTMFLVYFLPFIWLGNLILILVFKRMGFIVASVAKFLFLILIANIYFNFSVVPVIFLQAMGLTQLATALSGGLIAFIILKLHGSFSRSQKAS